VAANIRNWVAGEVTHAGSMLGRDTLDHMHCNMHYDKNNLTSHLSSPIPVISLRICFFEAQQRITIKINNVKL